MIRPLLPALLIALLATSRAGAADLCAVDTPDLIWRSCAAAGTVELRLLPEDAGPTPADALDVTGAYTATDRRAGDKPKPVGLFVRDGEIVSREYVRFDGVLIIENGVPSIHTRRAARLGGESHDLEDRAARAAFLDAAAGQGVSLLQSHLLIIDGEVDTASVAGAPRFRRRLLMTMADGAFALFDTSPRALTLHEAAEEAATRFHPSMALNLDMGSYDFCRQGDLLCGLLPEDQAAKLSNILRFR